MKNNLRMTTPRKKILDVVQTCDIRVFSAKELFQRLNEVDLATVYRNLDVFVETGIIRQVHLSEGEARYEYVIDNHHHVICDDCGIVKHIKMSQEVLAKIPGIKHFDQDKFEITIRGKCGHLSK